MENLKNLGYKGSTQGLPTQSTSSTASTEHSPTSTQRSNNFFNNVIAQGHSHQDFHAPTMWVTMSAIDNLNLKSMVQTINNVKTANNKDIMKRPHTRTSTITTPREGSTQELQDCQVMI
jgi:hypothetical protein